jgi:hypothetical protein
MLAAVEAELRAAQRAEVAAATALPPPAQIAAQLQRLKAIGPGTA